MKNESFSRIPYYLFRQRNPLKDLQTVLELEMPHAKPEIGQEFLRKFCVLRWEDDGGRVVESSCSILEQSPVQPVYSISRS